MINQDNYYKVDTKCLISRHNHSL